MKDQKLAPEKAGRELLANCFAAVRPDAEWFKYFREGIERVTGSIEEYGKSQANSLTLQAARRIAQEESFGSTALVRELNMAEILSRAQNEKDQLVEEQQAELQAIRAQSAQEKEKILADAGAGLAEAAREAERIKQESERIREEAVRVATEEAARMTETMVEEARLAVGRRNAARAIWAVRALCVVAFISVAGWGLYLRATAATGTPQLVASAILALISVLSFFNLIGVPVVKGWIERLESKLALALSK